MSGFQPLHRDHSDQLPLAPCWRVNRDHVLEATAESLTSELAQLANDAQHYWVLQQGPLAPGSKRQSLLNLDSDLALAAALNQTFQGDDGPENLIFQCMPPQKAAGVLFTRHPMRPDLEHIVIEGCLAGSDKQQRLILHADGLTAWRSPESEAFLAEISTTAFYQLAQSLHDSYGEPRAAEWVWDGQRLWMVQALPIGTLPMPSEVWTRRASLGFSSQAISPLWYTMLARWLKEGFWRATGRRAGWHELSNIEPYRRQHSYLYSNGRFFRALQEWQGSNSLWWALPPAWRKDRRTSSMSNTSRLPARLVTRLKLRWLSHQLNRLDKSPAEAAADDVWLELIRLDHLGERLAAIEGPLGYIIAPAVVSRGQQPEGRSLDLYSTRLLSTLAGYAKSTVSWEEVMTRFAGHSLGADPAFPRLAENASDTDNLKSLLCSLPVERLNCLEQLTVREAMVPGWLALRSQALALRRAIAGRLRELLQIMSQRLLALRLIKHPDDIYFLYFDELWQAWQGQTRRQLDTLLGERKVRYLSDAHAGPPDWVIDSIGYGTSPLGQNTGHDTVQGYGLVEGRVSGRVQRIGSGWQLNQVQVGDVLVLDQSDNGWLPWLATASGLVLAHRDPLDPAACLAKALGIPTVWGVDDAMHCLTDGAQVELDGSNGFLQQVSEPD